jgi:TorA maturation chaperone TorD
MSMEKDWVEFLEGEEVFFTLISRILSAPPDPQLKERLIREGTFLNAPFASEQPAIIEGLRLLQSWAEASAGVPETGTKAWVDQENQDYLALLGGLGAPLASPWESSYLSGDGGLIFQAETLEVRWWYERFGLQVRKKYHEPDDAIMFEFEFIAHLAGRAVGAYAQKDEQGFASLLKAQQDFLYEHLLRWGFHWCERVSIHAQTDFYRGLAKLAEGALRELEEAFAQGESL